jgi:flagellin
MRADIAAQSQATRNISDGISLLSVAESALSEISSIVIRMRELAIQASNGTYSGIDRSNLDREFTSLRNAIFAISESTKFNNIALLNDVTLAIAGNSSVTKSVQLGVDAADTLTIELGEFSYRDARGNFSASSAVNNDGSTTVSHFKYDELYVGDTVTITANGKQAQVVLTDHEHPDAAVGTLLQTNTAMYSIVSSDAGADLGLTLSMDGQPAFYVTGAQGESVTSSVVVHGGLLGRLPTLSLLSENFARAAAKSLSYVLDNVTVGQSAYGALTRRLESSHSMSQEMILNNSSAKSRIADTDYAVESADLARSVVLRDSSAAMLAQATTKPELVLSLIR